MPPESVCYAAKFARWRTSISAPRGCFRHNRGFHRHEDRIVSFFNLYAHNFVRAAVAIPEVRVADARFNADQIIDLMKQAAQRQAVLAVFPELALSAYSCEDLFHQQALPALFNKMELLLS